MPLYNKHGAIRKCSRCRSELATTRVKHEWLGPKCLQEREERRQRSAEQPDCELCRNKARLDSRYCGSCEDEVEEELEQQRKLADTAEEIAACETIEDIKEILMKLLYKVEGIEE